LRKNDNDNIEDRINTNPKDVYEPDWSKFRRDTRSRSRDSVNVNNYVLKPGEDPLKIVTPNNCHRALNKENPYHEEWLKAINKEMDTILQMGVFEDVPPNIAKTLKPFKSRIVFKVKIEADGTLIFKARLVVKGFSKRFGIDYDETFAPTVTFGTILLILHIAVTSKWHITGCGIGNAYLEALTNRDLYMELPTDYTGFEDKVVVRLIRNLYGSKQAAYMWYMLLCKVLNDFGFERSVFEPCCFILNKEGKHIIVCVYVDDLLITGNKKDDVEDVKTYLSKVFNKIKDLKNVEKYLGLKMTRNNNQLIPQQSDYIESILKEYENKDIKVKIKNTPLPHDLKPLVEEDSGRNQEFWIY
jgi:hypothetical protein